MERIAFRRLRKVTNEGACARGKLALACYSSPRLARRASFPHQEELVGDEASHISKRDAKIDVCIQQIEFVDDMLVRNYGAHP